jgi:hypothetical protein
MLTKAVRKINGEVNAKERVERRLSKGAVQPGSGMNGASMAPTFT